MPIVWAVENQLVITCNLCFPINGQKSAVEWELKELKGPCWWVHSWTGKISRWHISCCGRSVKTLYANDISCANRAKGSEPIQRRDVRAHYFTHTLILFDKKRRRENVVWPLTWADFSRKEEADSPQKHLWQDSWGGAWNPHMWFMAELCVPCRGRPRPLLHEDLLLSVATTLSTALQLLFDGSLWDFPIIPATNEAGNIFVAKAGASSSSTFFWFFFFFWWKIKTPTACMSWLHRLCRDKQLPRFITNTQTDFSISSFTPHIWTLLWYAKNVFSPKFFKQKSQINADVCFFFLFSDSLFFSTAFFGTRVSWDVW